MVKKYYPYFMRILWALFLVSLPVTNFPYFPKGFGGKVSVRPLLIYPLILLVMLYTLPAIWKKKLPRTWLPLLLFTLLAVVSSVLPFVLGFESDFKEVSLTSRTLRTIITLALGLAIYFTVSLFPEKKDDLRFTLKWIYIGMAIALLWGSIQILYVQDIIPGWYKMMRKVQKHISINRGNVDRIIGMTQEPSWFAGQIAGLWLPWIYPAVLLNSTIFNKRWRWITIEKILFLWMLFVLLFTLSRGGFVVAFVVITVGVVFLRPSKTTNQPDPESGLLGRIVAPFYKIPKPLRVAGISLLTLAGLSGVIYYASLSSRYIYRMWDYWLNISGTIPDFGSKSLSGYFRYVGFGPRFVYWETAFRIFLDYPIFGVGLGNYTFHFLDSLPQTHIGYMPEILTRLVPGNIRVITPKNYFARLLAEVGLFGTAAYISFLFMLFVGGLQLWLDDRKEVKFWGTGALLGLSAFLVDSFSYDSLAIPNPWVVFGLITAAMQVYLVKENQREKSSE